MTTALGDAGVDLVIAESVEEVDHALGEHAVQCVVSQYDVRGYEDTDTPGVTDIFGAVQRIDPDLPFVLVSSIDGYDVARRTFEGDVFGFVPDRDGALTARVLLSQIQTAISQLPARRRAAAQIPDAPRTQRRPPHRHAHHHDIIESHDWDFDVLSPGDQTRFEFREVKFI